MKKSYLFICFICVCLLLGAQSCVAETSEPITDWYLKNFDTSVTVNKDLSLSITELIIADCGDLPNKHGIFRVLPLQTKTDKGVIKTPVELVSITDFSSKPYKFETITENNTITWKIGDANKTVSGINYYKIVYKVKNAVRFGSADFDELYWNLTGNYWDIKINNFSAKISFPAEISENSAVVDYYTGTYGSKDKSLATYFWVKNGTLIFSSLSALQPKQGVTASITFPKGIFEVYQPTFWEIYGDYFWYFSFLIPITVFIFTFRLWRKYGKDPKMKKPIPPEFGIPDNITPMQMGMVITTGVWRENLITATIIDLAVRRFITIEELEKKALFFKHKEIKLTKNKENYDTKKLTETENILLGKLFSEGKDSVELSDLKDKFYQEVPAIKKAAKDDAIKQGWVAEKGFLYSVVFLIFGGLVIFSSFAAIAFEIIPLFISLSLSGIILFIFGALMPKRTQAGVDLLFKIKGFERYMRQAEDYRQQFYEKENIFDKFLPYAIVFGIAGLWAKKMQKIYGEDYFKNYHPIWFVGYNHANFDLNTFTSQLNSITTSISQTTSSYSGSAGAGGAGGGGGGGGGGGW